MVSYRVLEITEKGTWESKTVKSFSTAINLLEKLKQKPGIKKIGIFRKELGASILLWEYIKE